MSKKELLRRYLIFFIGLFLNAVGVAFVTKAALGTSPITSIPYTMSLMIPALSIGNWTILYSFLLIIIQGILLGKNANKIELVLQIAVSIALGYLIDFAMFFLQNFKPDVYVLQIISLLFGCCVIAFGAYLEVIADVVMLPGDAFVRVIAKVTHKEYGEVRVISDVSMTLVAGLLCLVFLHELTGVREGTLIAALFTGNMVKFYARNLSGFKKVLLP